MDKQTLDLLQQLAAKLGTTAEHLWAVLVRQAFCSGCADLLVYGLAGAFVWLTLRKTPKWIQTVKDAESDLEEAAYVVALAISWLLVVIFIIAAACSLGDTVAAFVNPEYWALKQILAAIGGNK